MRGPISGTKDASPFENWLASLLDHTVAEEQKYGWRSDDIYQLGYNGRA